ncbi:GGDEF domain-containing protein [Methylobacterium segetis]|uniref:GGDEF domain-containing protein n=1 Tax=Methylobacterium segetis TaxID=2488750 RepID=UPI0014042ADC|nr:sensor domain-containing diguanylate cyclase [Methylobacterium segetis]
MLRFSPSIERQFEADTGEARCRQFIRQNYIGLFIYHFFLVSDYRLVGDVFHLDLIMHFCVTTPMTFAAHLILAHNPPRWLRAGSETLVMAVVALTIIVVTCASRMPDRDILLFTTVLVVLFMIVMQGIEFFYAVAGCLAMFVMSVIAVITFTAFSSERMLMANSIMAGVMIFSLSGSYMLEHRTRTAYLLALRDRLRNRDLEIASLRDALTGIGNRRALDATLLRLLAQRGHEPWRASSILLLDIDQFKTFNDTNGHLAGDRCLKRVAGILASSVREDEGTVFRFGGEEFLVLLDDLPAPEGGLGCGTDPGARRRMPHPAGSGRHRFRDGQRRSRVGMPRA